MARTMERITTVSAVEAIICDACERRMPTYDSGCCVLCRRDICEQCYGHVPGFCKQCLAVSEAWLPKIKKLQAETTITVTKLYDGWKAESLAAIEAERNQKQEKQEP